MRGAALGNQRRRLYDVAGRSLRRTSAWPARQRVEQPLRAKLRRRRVVNHHDVVGVAGNVGDPVDGRSARAPLAVHAGMGQAGAARVGPSEHRHRNLFEGSFIREGGQGLKRPRLHLDAHLQ